MTSDLSRSQFPTQFHTIRVRNFKDSNQPTSLHGLYTDLTEAVLVALELTRAYPDFLEAVVVPIQFGTVEKTAQTQGVSHIEPTTDDTFAQIRDAVNRDSATPGTDLNPTPESLRDEQDGRAR